MLALPQSMSPEEYLAWEVQQPIRYVYINGQIFAMIAQPQVSRRYTAEEYLAQEIASDWRHEYINGEIVPMTGGTPDHNQILLNLAGALNMSLAQQPYRVFAADQRLWIPQANLYTYPDIMVVQGT